MQDDRLNSRCLRPADEASLIHIPLPIEQGGSQPGWGISRDVLARFDVPGLDDDHR
jgi:hypothetical protein